MAAQNTQEQPNDSTLKENVSTPVQETQKREAEKVLFQWRAAERPFKKRDRQFWRTVIVIATIFGLILFLVEGTMPVILIISVIFLFYVLSTVEPDEVQYQITNRGVKIADKTTQWINVTNFWFTQRLSTNLFIIGINTLPGRLEFVINPQDKEKIREAASLYVPEEETPPSGIDRATNWFSNKLPGDK
jgi:hypothetical protein